MAERPTLDEGFVQTSLTNFERTKFADQPARFQYEESSFQPDAFEMLGLGPAAICSAADQHFTSAWKTINPEASHDYIQAVDSASMVPDRAFRYDREDLKSFYLTRRLSAMRIETHRYHELFGSRPQDNYSEEFSACFEEGLLENQGGDIVPTPRGMFFSDSISALLAAPRLRAHRRHGSSSAPSRGPFSPTENDNAYGHM